MKCIKKNHDEGTLKMTSVLSSFYAPFVFCQVLSRGVIVLHGFKTVTARASDTVTTGSVSFQLSVGVNMAPEVQILVYCVLPSENIVVASASFDTETCFQNQVWCELVSRFMWGLVTCPPAWAGSCSRCLWSFLQLRRFLLRILFWRSLLKQDPCVASAL